MLQEHNGWVILITVATSFITLGVVLISVGKWLQRIERQVTPNGGNSNRLGDQVMQLRVEVSELTKEVEKLKGTLSNP